jgi:hypothetical protein
LKGAHLKLNFAGDFGSFADFTKDPVNWFGLIDFSCKTPQERGWMDFSPGALLLLTNS